MGWVEGTRWVLKEEAHTAWAEWLIVVVVPALKLNATKRKFCFETTGFLDQVHATVNLSDVDLTRKAPQPPSNLNASLKAKKALMWRLVTYDIGGVQDTDS